MAVVYFASTGALGKKGAARMGEQITDKTLVERVQRGDKKAFDLLVLRYQQRITNLVSRYVRDPGDAMDVTQEAFLKAYRALPRFRGESAFYTWLYRIAINTAKNFLVVQSRRPVEGNRETLEAEDYDLRPELRENATPENLALADEIRETIVAAVDDLPQDLRTAITLREAEGMSYEDIADSMSCPIGTVRSRIFRAREAIDNRLKPLLD